MKDINYLINQLLTYGVNKKLLNEDDFYYSANRLIDYLKVDEFKKVDVLYEENISIIIKDILIYAVRNNLIERDLIIFKDLFDTELMNCLMPRPSEVNERFWMYYHNNPISATNYYYQLSNDSNYIRKDRINKNILWKTSTKYGDIDITINLSKPEKDPVAISLLKNTPKKTYPKCLLCRENEGYIGSINHPARGNHRIIKLNLNNEEWFLQYSPYVYYNEHCIVLKGKHEPMLISKETFKRLLDFVEQFKHYFLGSNADLPIVGGSILDHDHFQGGNHNFAMMKASIKEEISFSKFPNIEAGILNWPLSVLRLRSENKENLIILASLILDRWKDYSDESAGIYAFSNGEPHNTITPIARFSENKYELNLVLRNNRTNEKYPLGIFHPHNEHHHLKRENIGLIEVMGLAVLPGRLAYEINLVKECILNNTDIYSSEEISKHADWVNNFIKNYDKINEGNIDKIIRDEIGKKFINILEQCGVFKNNELGLIKFMDFIKEIE